MLDPEAADEAREKVAGDVRQAIEGAGTLDRADVWGMRKLAFEIKQRNEAKAFSRPIVTTLEPLTTFYPAEDYHQDYARNNPGQPYIKFHSLPKAYQQTVAMRVVDGMTGPEIAKRTGLSAGSVRVNLHRGMRMLRARLKATLKGSPYVKAVSLRRVSRRCRSRGRPPARATTRA